MTPSAVDRRVVVDRLAIMQQMLEDIRALPLDRPAELAADRRNLWTMEACLRRSPEALFDIGRHILARGFGRGVSEYREIAVGLGEVGVLSSDEAALLARMAGYRNRLVYLYHDVSEADLHDMARHHLPDIERVAGAYRAWVSAHPDQVTEGL
jgi:uncharacterized protein YutE (UPF0331/DUF86 family)